MRKCGFKPATFKHPLKLVGFIDAAFKAQFEEPIGLAIRGFVAALQEDACSSKPMGTSGGANLVDFTARRQRRVARCTSSAELIGSVDRMGQMMLPQVALHPIYRGTTQGPEIMADLLESGMLHPPLDL